MRLAQKKLLLQSIAKHKALVTLQAGRTFGELALLHEEPRAASV